MNTTAINKAEIATKLRDMVEERLFGDKPWPVDNNDEVHQQLLDWGLIVYDEIGFCSTPLGVELDVDFWQLLTGHHELSEIPHHLAECGLITQEEADGVIFDRWERDGEKLESILPPILRRVYRAQSE
jgi:hypothetical protein